MWKVESEGERRAEDSQEGSVVKGKSWEGWYKLLKMKGVWGFKLGADRKALGAMKQRKKKVGPKDLRGIG